MKPESHRAYLELSSFGVEELSSAQAAQLMKTVDDCPECHGQWVLFSRTISTLSQVGELPVSHDKSHDMWLVCVQHANQKVAKNSHSNGAFSMENTDQNAHDEAESFADAELEAAKSAVH